MAEAKKETKKKNNKSVAKIKKVEKENKEKPTKNETKTTKRVAKKSAWVRFRIFCHGVKSEFDKVHWPTKKDMIRHSIAVILFIIFCAIFFFIINVAFAFVQSLFN